MPHIATALMGHALEISPGHTDTTNSLIHSQDMPSRLDQPPSLSNHHTWLHHNPSHSFMTTKNETSNHPPLQQQHHTSTLPMLPQHFDKVFWAMQQQIQEQHLILDTKIQQFLASLEQRQDNPSQMVPSPPKQNHTIDAIYSRPVILKYFFNEYCSPTIPRTHWHHCSR